MIDSRTRIVAVVGCVLLLVLVVELVRRRKLKEDYSLLWFLTAIIMLVVAASPPLLTWMTSLVGGVAQTSTLFLLGLLFAFFMLLHFSVRVSALERRLTRLVQEIGVQSALDEVGEDTLPLANQGDEGASPP